MEEENLNLYDLKNFLDQLTLYQKCYIKIENTIYKCTPQDEVGFRLENLKTNESHACNIFDLFMMMRSINAKLFILDTEVVEKILIK